jgi:hypothetical protein
VRKKDGVAVKYIARNGICQREIQPCIVKIVSGTVMRKLMEALAQRQIMRAKTGSPCASLRPGVYWLVK